MPLCGTHHDAFDLHLFGINPEDLSVVVAVGFEGDYHRNVLAILFVANARLLTRIAAGDKCLGLGSTAKGGDRMFRPMVQVFAATAVVGGSDITTSITLAT